MSASDVITRLQSKLGDVRGITLYMQPVQDLTVEDRVSRTQFQYTMEDPSAAELNDFVPKMVEKLQQLPELRDVATDQQVGGLRARLVFDRDTASRLGITPSTIDNTLYDAYGQRLVSTMFTQLNQYHVVLEVNPGFMKDPKDLRQLFIRSSAGGSTERFRASSPRAPRWSREMARRARPLPRRPAVRPPADPPAHLEPRHLRRCFIPTEIKRHSVHSRVWKCHRPPSR